MMTKTLVTVLALAAATLATAQVKEGRVVYERKINMHKRMPPEAEQYKAMVPEFQTSKMELLFNGSQSLFRPLPDEADQMPAPSGDGGVRRGMMMGFGGPGGGNAETFRDYDKELSTESRELGPKKYLIDDTLRRIKWKLEEDTMTIGGYLCRKATTKAGSMMQGGMRMFGGGQRGGGGAQNQQRADSMAKVIQEMEVVAWFAEQIETPAGPENYFGLPGLILRVDMDNGTMTYTAQSMEPLGKSTVKAPTSGKKITREEYRKLVEEQFQGMRMGGPGGGNTIIIRQ